MGLSRHFLLADSGFWPVAKVKIRSLATKHKSKSLSSSRNEIILINLQISVLASQRHQLSSWPLKATRARLVRVLTASAKSYIKNCWTVIVAHRGSSLFCFYCCLFVCLFKSGLFPVARCLQLALNSYCL